MYKPKRIIVIGGNAAGPSAAAKAKRVNPEAEVIMIEASDYISTGTCEIPYLFSGEIDNFEKLLFFSAESFNVKKGVKVYTNTYVTKIDRKHRKILAHSKYNNEEIIFYYDKLIIATGAKSIALEELPFSLDNVFPLKSMVNYVDVNTYIQNNSCKRILIIGAGYIGLEVADSLSRSNFEVSILEKNKYPLANFDYEVQNIALDLIQKSNVNFLQLEPKTRFILRNNKLVQLCNQGYYIDFDLVIVSAGIKANSDLAEDAGIKICDNGAIQVDSKMKTSDPNIYAAGDVIEVKDFITNKYSHVPLATIAHSSGHIAGENAAGGNAVLKNVISNSAFNAFGKSFAKVGLSEHEANKYFRNSKSVSGIVYNKVKVMPNASKVFGKIVYDEYSKQILGATFVGNEEVSGFTDLIAMMIRNRIGADKLHENNYNYTPPLSPFINILSVLGRKIMRNWWKI